MYAHLHSKECLKAQDKVRLRAGLRDVARGSCKAHGAASFSQAKPSVGTCLHCHKSFTTTDGLRRHADKGCKKNLAYVPAVKLHCYRTGCGDNRSRGYDGEASLLEHHRVMCKGTL